MSAWRLASWRWASHQHQAGGSPSGSRRLGNCRTGLMGLGMRRKSGCRCPGAQLQGVLDGTSCVMVVEVLGVPQIATVARVWNVVKLSLKGPVDPQAGAGRVHWHEAAETRPVLAPSFSCNADQDGVRGSDLNRIVGLPTDCGIQEALQCQFSCCLAGNRTGFAARRPRKQNPTRKIW